MKKDHYYLHEADKELQLYFKEDNALEDTPHFHDSVEFIVPTSGKIKAHLDNKEHLLTKGDIFFADSYSSHYYSILSKNATAIVLVVGREYLKTFNNLFPNYSFANFMLDKNKNEPIINFLLKWLKYPKKTVLYNMGNINILFAKLVDAYPLDKIKNDDNSNNLLVKKMLIYIHEHYLEDISLSSIANHLGYSVEHCSKILKKATKCNFRTYLNILRLRKATELLNDKSLGLTKSEVFYQCGFTSAATFYRVKKQLGY